MMAKPEAFSLGIRTLAMYKMFILSEPIRINRLLTVNATDKVLAFVGLAEEFEILCFESTEDSNAFRVARDKICVELCERCHVFHKAISARTSTTFVDRRIVVR